MSGPQGSDPTGWQGQDQPAQGSEQPPVWGQPAGSETPAWQPQAYPQQYQYGQPQGYPAAPPYGAPQTGAPEYNPGFFVTTKLDVNKAQQGVQQILTDESNGYGAKNVKDVKCNNGANPTVKKGDNFTCEVSIDGTKRQVTVTFQDDKGTYEVGRPK